MNYGTKEISKEVYDRALANNSQIASEDMIPVFGVCLVRGYGIYLTRVYEKDNKYYVNYSSGSHCD